MPIRTKKHRALKITEEMECFLLEGWAIGGDPFKDAGHMKRVWEEHKDVLLEKVPPGCVAHASRVIDGDERDLPSVLHFYATNPDFRPEVVR